MMLENTQFCPCCDAEVDMYVDSTIPVQYFTEECDICGSFFEYRYVTRDEYIVDIRIEMKPMVAA
jgi:uncharacterized protein (UPF0212 family)